MHMTRVIALICLFVGASSSFAQQDTRAIVKKRVIDKKFWAVGAGYALSTAFDIETTHRGLSSCSGSCREANPIAGLLISRNRPTAYAMGAAVSAGAIYIMYWQKKKGHRTWWVSPVAVTAIHTTLGTANLRFVRQ